MTRDELIEKVATMLADYDGNDMAFSESVINTIFDALKEPTDEMATAAFDTDEDDCIWQAMLNASPLAKEG